MYPLQPALASSSPVALTSLRESGDTWHKRLGHCGHQILGRLVSNKAIVTYSKFDNICVSCRLGKSHRLPFTLVEHCFSTPFYLIHSDLWQSPVPSNLGYNYYICFVDDCTRYTWIYPMKRKSEAFSIFYVFRKMVENVFNATIKLFQSNGGLEYDNSPFQTQLLDLGILFRKSCPHTPQQNGVAERKHRHIIEMTRTLLIDANMPGHFWVDAAYHACYTINRLPTPTLDKIGRAHV